MAKKDQAAPVNGGAVSAQGAEPVNVNNLVFESAGTNQSNNANALEFEKVELGNFEFFKFDRDGQSITGTFIGILHDTVRDKNKPDYTGSPDVLRFQKGEICGIVMKEYETKRNFMLPLHYQTENFFEQVCKNEDPSQWVFRITRVKKEEGAQGFMTFDIDRAKIR